MTQNYYPPIGVITTCFKEKFGVPRQSGMVTEARAVLKLNDVPEYKLALSHLEDFSHIWVLFVFHKHTEMKWKPTIHPPRVDAPRKIGVFASRSPHRPNPIGMSAVKLDKIDWDAKGGIEIHLSGVDFLDETPVIDIKPYLPYTDRILEANGGWAEGVIPHYPVHFSSESELIIEEVSLTRHPGFGKLLFEMLQWDPRPTSQKRTYPIEDSKNDGMQFGFHCLDFDVKWRIENKGIYVLELVKV
ncbi:MAG: tRNA (N6-threonylcarbamoyladenosine(37)-N6)-methyltransferase TrmO [Bacteriovorax sp.]|nr:tRNA (N6-threonylcarbamoyladenosine(37)-N6)-methyltransferase TrmO [Bacteriovorax sp.]